MADEITITIDGVQVKTRPGNNVLQAALDAGIYIPYLCYYPTMKSYGACRMCVVEIEGARGTPASCTTPVADGMVVRTKTDNIVQLRRGIMEMLLSEHPHGCLTCHRIELCGPGDICLRHVSVNDRCVTCPKNERCELKDTARFLQMPMDLSLTYNYRHEHVKVDDPFWDMDMNLCIVCARCVRVCDEVRGDSALTLLERAGRVLIGTAQGTSLLESGCEFCGACLDVCPTGAIVERPYKWEKAVRVVKSICPHCPVGCQMKMEVDRRGRLIRGGTDIHAPANRGQVCFKGKFGLDFVNDRRRLTKPLVRRDGELVEASWDEALDLVAQELARFRNDGYAMVTSPRNTNEEHYLAQKFARAVMGTNSVNVATDVRPYLVGPLARLLGYAAATNPLWDLERSKCYLVVGSNVTEEQNVVAVPIKKALKAGTASLIVIDQRETELARHATVWLRPRPGSELVLLGGLLRVIMDESLEDHDFLADRCRGLSEFRNSLWAFDPLKVEEDTGVPEEALREAARLFATARPGAILYSLETVAPEAREDCVTALVDLALATGNLGIQGGGLYPLFLGANEQGARDVGAAPDLLPGYRPAADASARQALSEAWGVALPEAPGVALQDLPAALREGRIKALHLLGDSATYTDGSLPGFLEAAREAAFVVVQDALPGPLLKVAHVVLPTTTFAEKSGTYTNLERRVQLLRPVIAPRGEARDDWWVLSQLARRLGAQGFEYEGPEAIFQELRQAVEVYRGITYGRLEEGGLQWPVPSEEVGDTPVLYAEGFVHGPAALTPLTPRAAAPATDDRYPLMLAVGRVLHQPDREAAIERVEGVNAVRRDEIVELHPDDAEAMGIRDGDLVEVETPGVSFRGVARLTGPMPGLASMTLLFGQLASELYRSQEPDPMLRLPGLPLTPARVVRREEAEAAAD